MQGYKQALADHKIKFRQENLIINNLSQEAGFASADILMKMDPRPDAVFAANDNCAVGCMIALKKAGMRIPEDIAFVGFNNDPVSKVIEPNLTTINYPGYEMGQVAAQNLINHLNGTVIIKTANTILLHSELIIRASSKRKKK
jgi:LacI family transcriptional regulator